jgi:hypothetical protein
MDKTDSSFFIGLFIGCVAAFVGLSYNNLSYEALGKAEQICETFKSTPESFDLAGELVCENGVTVNYRKFGETL